MYVRYLTSLFRYLIWLRKYIDKAYNLMLSYVISHKFRFVIYDQRIKSFYIVYHLCTISDTLLSI